MSITQYSKIFKNKSPQLQRRFVVSLKRWSDLVPDRVAAQQARYEVYASVAVAYKDTTQKELSDCLELSAHRVSQIRDYYDRWVRKHKDDTPVTLFLKTPLFVCDNREAL